MHLSIVIPTLNEALVLGTTLTSLPSNAETIISDGGSIDATLEIASKHGVRIITGHKGRAAQMNRGARIATGDVLLFLHADCTLSTAAEQSIAAAINNPLTVGGSFRLCIDNSGVFLRLIAFTSNIRATYLNIPYGDQGIFVKRHVFKTLGGFPELPIMEDVAFVQQLNKQGKLVRLKEDITTGQRHWKPLGVIATTLLNWIIATLYLIGISPKRLARIYSRVRGDTSTPTTDKLYSPS